eukprot:gene38634-52196_t
MFLDDTACNLASINLLPYRNTDGTITRIALSDGANREYQLLVQNGVRPAVWRSHEGKIAQLEIAALFQPVVPGVDLTAFDMQMPFLHWPNPLLEKLTRMRGRPAHVFVFRPPSAFVASYPDLGAVRVYLDTQYNAPTQIESLNREARVTKTVSLLDLKKVGEQWIPKSFEARNEMTRDKTRLTVTAAALGLAWPSAIFSPARAGGGARDAARPMRRPYPTTTVVFDLDGTLVDSLPLVLRAISHAIEPFGPHRPTMDIFARLGGPPDRFMPDLLEDPKNTRQALERMARFHRENQHLIHPFDGVGVVLERLRSAGLDIAVWTGRDRHSTEQILREHALTDYFSTVVCGDDLPTHKPEPEGLREILRRLEVSATETVFVGDADVDVLGGAACAVDTVLIRHARQIEEAVRAKAWRIVTSPLEAYEIVLSCAAVPDAIGVVPPPRMAKKSPTASAPLTFDLPVSLI